MTDIESGDSPPSEELEIVDAFRNGMPEPLSRESNGSTVLSVRLSRELLRELTAEAKRRNEPVGRLARKLIESGLAQEETAGVEVLLSAALARLDEETSPVRRPRIGTCIYRSSSYAPASGLRGEKVDVAHLFAGLPRQSSPTRQTSLMA